MRDYLEPMLGATGALIAQFAITLLIILVLVLIVFWLIRRFTGGRFGTGSPRGRQPRLSLLDALPIDQRRRLVLVRRDNVEHLLLIGGPSDVVVETSIQRPPPAQRRAEATQPRAAAPSGRGPAPGPTEATRAAASAMEARRAEAPPAEAPLPEPEPTFARHVEAASAELPPPPAHSEESGFAASPAPDFPAPARPTPPAQRPARGMPAFLAGGRSRSQAAPTEPVQPPRREGRVRIADAVRPLQRATSSPFAREPSRAAEAEPVQPSPRVTVPPAPPIDAPAFGDEPFGAPEPSFPARIEPTIERRLEAPPVLAEEPETLAPVPAVEPPVREDQPISIDDEFGEEAPLLRHGEPAPESDASRARSAQVGDLEKEMARLLGEISGGKR